MAKLTITEALAEIKTITKRIEKKHQFVLTYLYRQEKLKDPLDSTGGSKESLKRERQSIADLAARCLALRRGIQKVNSVTGLAVLGVERTIGEWLIWRRDIAPGEQARLQELSQRIAGLRRDAMGRGLTVTKGEPVTPDDVIVNLDEGTLAKEIEDMAETLGVLDGQLSLKNATTFIEIPD